MIKVKQFVFNAFGVNTYVVWDSDSRKAIVVDPGMASQAEQHFFDTYISENSLEVTQVVNTHMHVDHCIGNYYVANKYGTKVAASQDDAFLGARVAQQAQMFGMPTESTPKDVGANVTLVDGDVIRAGNLELHILAVPGHSPGSIALYSPAGKFVIVGDALFRGAIGRTDLPGGDFDTLIKSIKDKLYTLPDDTRVLAGHEASTTIGAEKASNPYTW